MITVDGTDFKIQEPYPWKTEFNRKFFSSKFKGPGLRYEIGVCIKTGFVVWYHGPFPCGAFPDIKIYNLKLKTLLLTGEKVIADKGYKGDFTVCTPLNASDEDHKKSMSISRARHETINRRFKQMQALKQVWRHDRTKHIFALEAVLALTQLEFENGHPPFQVTSYNDILQF